jgi:transposase-like protein
MIKKMNCPSCGMELMNNALFAEVEEGFQCAECNKDFNQDGEEIEEDV